LVIPSRQSRPSVDRYRRTPPPTVQSRRAGVQRPVTERLHLAVEDLTYLRHLSSRRLAFGRRARGWPRPCLVACIEHDLGVPLISLNSLTGNRSTPRRLRRPGIYADTGSGAGYRRLSGGWDVASSGDWDLSNPAFALSCGSRSASFHTPEHDRCFPGMLLSPSPFGSR
jgi:hypothetical protein